MTYSTTKGIASRVDLARTGAGLSVDALAAAIGVDEDHMEQMLRGGIPWQPAQVAQAAIAVRARIDYLLIGMTQVAS